MIDPFHLPRGSFHYLKITSKRQVTFPAHVLDDLGLTRGDRVMLIATEDGYLLKPRSIDMSKLAPLKGEIRFRAGAFDLDTFRRESHDSSIRD